MSEQVWLIVLSASLLSLPIIQGSRHFQNLEENVVETIFATKDEHVRIECNTDMPIAYCGFVDPSGKRYSFTGSTLSAGHCYKDIIVEPEDDGQWRCHIGGHDTGIETMKTIQLRVVNDVAALHKNITVTHGKSITLSCMTTKTLTPLSYCRFEPPKGKPFHISQDVTVDNPILGRYYFPQNMSSDRGDCAVTIYGVKYEDYGTWTCGAGLDDGNEHIDTINLEVEGIYTMSTASAIGIAVGCISTISLIGYFAYKKRQLLGSTPRQSPVPAESHELELLEPQAGRSNEELNIPQVRVEPPSDSSSTPTP